MSFKTVDLVEVHVLSSKEKQRQTVNTLQELGVLHIDQTPICKGFSKGTTMKGSQVISELLLKLRYIVEHSKITHKFTLQKLPSLGQVIKEAHDFIDDVSFPLEKLKSHKEQLQRRVRQLKAQLELTSRLPSSLHISSKKSRVFVANKPCSKTPGKTKHHKHKGRHYYVLECDNSTCKKWSTKNTVKELNLKFFLTSVQKTSKYLTAQIAQTSKEIKSVNAKKIALMNGKESYLLYLVSALENYYAQYTIVEKGRESTNFFLLTGFCEASDVDIIKSRLKDTSIFVKPAQKGAPSKLKHGKLGSSFSQITRLFGMPRYGGVDPTPIVTFFYPLFFGFMLSDIGYGLLLLISVLLIRYVYGSKLNDALIIFGLSAISSMFFGLLFGSFFGNLVTITPLYIASFAGSFTILKIALLIGLVHLNLGVALNIYQNMLKKESIGSIVLKASPFVLLQATAVLLYLKQYIAASIIGLVLIYTLVREKGLFGIMDVTGFFGTWFSYARLLALSLATAGVAFAVNIIAQKALLAPKIGIVLWGLVLLVGHLFNFVLNVLGCTIHAARLHYVEFFGFFYESEGEEFTPFKLEKTINLEAKE